MHINRRNMMVGSVAALGLTDAVLAANGVGENEEKALIWVWLGGGCSFVDTWNPLPDSTFDEYRSICGFTDTNVPGLKFSSYFPKMGSIADKMTVVRSFCHTNPDHSFATHLLQTGVENRQAGQSHPSIGSMVSNIHGGISQAGLPYFCKTNSVEHDGPSWLGAAYGPFDVNSDAKKNFLPQVEHERLRIRASLLSQMDSFQQANPRIRQMNELKGQAYNIIFGNAREAFEVQKEDQKVRDLYGPGFGMNLLAARRLVQHGAKCVQVSIGGFDLHQNIKEGMDRLGPQLDNGIFSLLTDLDRLGMLDHTMVAVASEFSRTKVNSMAGRDHNARSCPLVIAGGSFNHAGVIGATDKTGLAVENDPKRPVDLVATIFKHFGIPIKTQKTNHQGRPIYLAGDGSSIL